MPCKEDYWSTNDIDPKHWMGNGNFPRHRFRWVWRNISIDPSFASDDYDDKTDEPATGDIEDGLVDDEDEDVEHQNDDVEEMIYEEASDEENDDRLSVEPEQPEEEDEGIESNSDEESDYLAQAKHTGETFHDIEHRKKLKRPRKKKAKWYKKAEFFMNWLNKFSGQHCVNPVCVFAIFDVAFLYAVLLIT